TCESGPGIGASGTETAEFNAYCRTPMLLCTVRTPATPAVMRPARETMSAALTNPLSSTPPLVGLDRDRERRDAAFGEQRRLDPRGDHRVLQDAFLVVFHGGDVFLFR